MTAFIIPTTDYGIVPTLLRWLGPDVFRQAVDCGAIGFLRRHGCLGYAGNGNAISNFVIEIDGESAVPWDVRAMWARNEESVALQIDRSDLQLPIHNRGRLVPTIVNSSTSLQYENDAFMQKIANESYEDVIRDEAMSSWIRGKSGSSGAIDLLRLPTVGPD